MSPSPPTLGNIPAAPRFYVTPGRKLSPAALLLAIAIALALLTLVLRALRQPNAVDGASDDDDPSQVDTIYLGDPGQAPVVKRPATRPNTVHPFVVVHLPRSGSQAGMIPDTPSGRRLYAWLAAFNGTDPSALTRALPTPEPDLTQAAQVELRRRTGGFALLSAKEVEPGVLVFRLQDQTPLATEVLGTLVVGSGDAGPPRTTSFSLRAVPPPPARH